MSWLALIVTPIVTWLLSLAERSISSLIRIFTFRRKLRKISEGNDAQAQEIDKIIKRIRALKAKGLPVPPELDEELVRESSKINIGAGFN